jgi:hypothetical protein
LSRGNVSRAESLYYAASDARPRDPVARAALGRYLAARGAVPVAAVLLEEARTFGGDANRLDHDLALLYEQMNDFASLARLPASAIRAPARARAAWLVAAGTGTRMADVTAVRYAPTSGTTTLGQLAVHVNGEVRSATLDPDESRVLIDTRATTVRGLKTFPGDDGHPGETLAVADSVSIGEITLTNVPVTIASLPHDGTVVIGMGFLARYAPTLDAMRASITLRATGTVVRDASALRVPLLFTAQGPRALVGARWSSLAAAALRTVQGNRAITIDARRGELVIGP